MSDMNIKEYIASGILELYVAGTLTPEQNKEVYTAMKAHPKILTEVLQIEAAIMKLSGEVSPLSSNIDFQSIRNELRNQEDLDGAYKSTTNWIKYSGWAAAIIMAGGLMWTVSQMNELNEELKTVEITKDILEQQIENANTDLVEANKLISVLRDRSIISVPLSGQTVYPSAFATVYWDQNNESIYLDAQGLPEPPEGMVYQVWSLKLNPLSPTSLGVIDDFTEDENKIFSIANANASEAFGITLEPEGGSESPTLEQLYTLGVVETAP